MTSGEDRWWTVQRGAGPVIATAIHDGARAARRGAAGNETRRGRSPARGRSVHRPGGRPTCRTISSSTARGSNSTSTAGRRRVYETPEQCWGLDVWHAPLGPDVVRTIARHPRALLPDARPVFSTTSRPIMRASSCSTSTATTTAATAPTARRLRRPMRPTSTSALSRCRAISGRSCIDPLMRGDARIRFQRPPPRRARECRLPGQGRAGPLRPRPLSRPRLRDRARVQEILHGRMDRRARSGRAGRDAPLHRLQRATSRGRCCNDAAFASPARAGAVRARIQRNRRAAPARSARAAERISTGRCSSSFFIAAPIPTASLARRVAINSPAYLIWGPEDDLPRPRALRRDRRGDARALSAVSCSSSLYRPAGRAARARMRPICRRSPRPIAATGDDAARPRAADTLGKAMRRGRDRPAQLRRRPGRRPTARTVVDPALVDGDSAIARLSFALPQIHRAPDGERLSATGPRPCRWRSGDALLRAACAFIDDGQGAAPRPLSRARAERVPRRGARRRPQARPDLAQLRFPAVGVADQHRRGDSTSSWPTKAQAAATSSYRPLDGRSRRRQAQALRDRSDAARGPLARDGCCPKNGASSTSS